MQEHRYSDEERKHVAAQDGSEAEMKGEMKESIDETEHTDRKEETYYVNANEQVYNIDGNEEQAYTDMNYSEQAYSLGGHENTSLWSEEEHGQVFADHENHTYGLEGSQNQGYSSE